MRSCSARSENVCAIAGHPGLQPDILITAPDRAPVIIEAEFDRTYTVAHEGLGRLGLEYDLLGFRVDVYRKVRLLAAKWCAEPLAHGGKRKPRGAR